MINADTMIMFGGQAISDNNLKFSHNLKYRVISNKLSTCEAQLMRADKFFFNN